MAAQLLVLGVLPVLLAIGACWDVASFKIPNFISLAVLGAFAAFAIAERMSPGVLGGHLLAGSMGLTAGFFLFALGYIGGGDAKFVASILVWLGAGRDAVDYVLVAALVGGALTVLLLSLRSMPLPSILAGRAWISRLHDSKAGIPYGVALSAGALLILPYTEIFRAAVRV
jgi:prepilin peptidase CpaA